MIGGFQPLAFQPAYQQVQQSGRRGGGVRRHGIWYQGKRKPDRLIDLPNKHLDSILAEVEAEVLYREIAEETRVLPDAARQAVAPFTKSEAAKPQVESVDWQALDRDAESVGTLLRIWMDIQRKKAIRAAEEEWLLLGD